MKMNKKAFFDKYACENISKMPAIKSRGVDRGFSIPSLNKQCVGSPYSGLFKTLELPMIGPQTCMHLETLRMFYCTFTTNIRLYDILFLVSVTRTTLKVKPLLRYINVISLDTGIENPIWTAL